MSRFIRTVFASVAAVAWLWYMTRPAFAQAAPSTNATFSVDQTRAAFSNAGYRVGESHTWDWMEPPFTSFRVSDPATDRMLTVMVYANVDAADTARLQAAHGHTQDDSSHGPALVTGFGPSFWSGNVALVQSTESTFQRLYQLQVARDMSVNGEAAPALERPVVTVDVDFARALVTGAVDL